MMISRINDWLTPLKDVSVGMTRFVIHPLASYCCFVSCCFILLNKNFHDTQYFLHIMFADFADPTIKSHQFTAHADFFPTFLNRYHFTFFASLDLDEFCQRPTRKSPSLKIKNTYCASLLCMRLSEALKTPIVSKGVMIIDLPWHNKPLPTVQQDASFGFLLGPGSTLRLGSYS